ncbi:MAG TPA: sodium:proton antiporter [Bacteroidetes bacterium]|nr:sodium:proton antiporter [Bacteroidota bacterium]
MLDSLSEIIIASLLVAWLFKKIKVPELVGILFVGILFGPYVLNWMSPKVMDVSGELRTAALIVILLSAGFELKKDTLKRIGRSATFLSFIPALFEATAVTFLAHWLLGLSYMEGAMLGAILGAVSPAVVVPLMIKMIKERRGTNKGIPTLLLAGSSVDDVTVIVAYSILIGFYVGNNVNIAWKIASIPLSIVSGVGIGLAIGWGLYKLFDKYNPRATKRVLIIMAVSILLLRFEKLTEAWFPFAALLAVMAIGIVILEKRGQYAEELSLKLAKVWIIAEIILFTMVGAEVNVHVALKTGARGALLIFLALIVRSIGTWISVGGNGFTRKEKWFCVISYIPKATVQAAIGAAPLAAMQAAGMNTYPGEVILAMAVLSIILTAPIGAWAIDFTGKRWLFQEAVAAQEEPNHETEKAAA